MTVTLTLALTLTLPGPLRAQILAEARDAHPRECCGLVLGRHDGEGATTALLHPARNLAKGEDRFELAPQDHFAALKCARAQGQALIGCYHSHPRGAAFPSAADLAGAGEEGFYWVIAAGGALAAFVYRHGRFSPATLVISP